ncbi:MAG: hypothetical protein L3J74_13615 [Bacteroidales bacterium]|nr:hypothetical protein [Bacteroidales bacterium]
MKKVFTTFILILFFTISWGQNDTTIIHFGDKKIIIIEKDKKELNTQKEKLQQGKAEFETMLEELEKQKLQNEKELERLQKQLEETSDEEVLKQLEESLKKQEQALENLEKQQKALRKGIEDIENELNNSEDDFDKFDWNDDEKEIPEDNHDEWEFNYDFNPFKNTKNFNGHWAGFEIGLNNWVNKDQKFTLDPYQDFELTPEKSWVFTLNFMEFNIPFGKRNGLVTGMGSTWNLYHFRNNVNITENAEGIIVAEPVTNYELSKNNLNLWYFNVPLLYEFQIPVKNSSGIHVGFGVVGSLKLSSKYVQKYNGSKQKDKSDFQIPGFKYGLTFRLGYKYINLFANYDVTPLFKENRGPELYPVSVGLVLLPFD